MSSEVDPKGLEAAARALCEAKGVSPSTLFQIHVFTGDEPFDHEDTAGRRFEYAWRKQVQYAEPAIEAYLSASPSIGRVGVADVEREPAEERFKAALGRYESPADLARGLRMFAEYWRDKPPSRHVAQPRIMADFHDRAAVALERLIALVYHEEPAGDTQGALPERLKWCQPMENGKQVARQFIVRFEDADRGDAVFTDEAEAREFFARANTNWNCYLFGKLEAHPAALVSPPDNGEAVREAMLAARHLAKTMEGLTGCRSDDDYVWAAQAKIEAGLAALQSHNEGSDGK